MSTTSEQQKIAQLLTDVSKLKSKAVDLQNAYATLQIRVDNMDQVLSDLKIELDQRFTDLFGQMEAAREMLDEIFGNLGLGEGVEQEEPSQEGFEGRERRDESQEEFLEEELELPDDEETIYSDEEVPGEYEPGDLEGEPVE